MITLHCRSSWNLLAAPPYDLTVIKPISITQWTCLPQCVHTPRWSQTRASSWGETWIADFLTWQFISHSPKLVWFKAVLWGCCFCSHVEVHGKVFCSIMPTMSWEKRGDYFLEVLSSLCAWQLSVLTGDLTETCLSLPVMDALIHRERPWVAHWCRQEPCWNKSHTLNLYSLIPSVNLTSAY